MAENQEVKGKKRKELLLPKNDIVFQALFTRGRESITKALLEDILNIKINKLDLDKSKDLLNENTEDKNGRLDLRAIINENIECDIEVQLSAHEKLMERFLYYWAKMYTANLKVGDKYKELRKTISIIIVDDNIEQFREIEKSCTKWRITEEKYYKIKLTDYFELYIIELPKAIKEYEKNKKDEVLQWMMFLENPEDAEVAKIMEENEDIKKAKEELDRISQDDLLRRRLLKAELLRMDQEQREDDAMARGEEKGKQEEKIEIAKNLLKKNILIEIITDATGLSNEEIEKIRKNEE